MKTNIQKTFATLCVLCAFASKSEAQYNTAVMTDSGGNLVNSLTVSGTNRLTISGSANLTLAGYGITDGAASAGLSASGTADVDRHGHALTNTNNHSGRSFFIRGSLSPPAGRTTRNAPPGENHFMQAFHPRKHTQLHAAVSELYSKKEVAAVSVVWYFVPVNKHHGQKHPVDARDSRDC